MKVKKRLDVLLTEQGYADTRSKAQAIIMSGLVYVNGQKATSPACPMRRRWSWKSGGRSAPMSAGAA